MMKNRTITILFFLITSMMGGLLAFAFPKWDKSILAWVCIFPLVYAMTARPKLSFWYGFAFGVPLNYIMFYWIVVVIKTYSNVPFILAALLTLLLSAYLSLYWALWAFIGSTLIHKIGTWSIWLLPFAWVALEYIRSYFLTGFPWCLLGYSQYRYISFCQIASVTGVYGISFLLILINIQLAVMFCKRLRHKGWYLVVASNFLIIILIVVWGSYRKTHYHDTAPKVTVGIIQGNISQDIKWDPSLADEHFSKHVLFTKVAALKGARLIVWPEASVTFFFIEEYDKNKLLMDLITKNQLSLLFGGDNRQINGNNYSYYNSAFFIEYPALEVQIYSKMHLVPFGEYVPIKKVLWFVHKFVEGVSDFSAGNKYILFKNNNHRISTQICYEIIFPEISRKFVQKGSELLTTITNDAWFGVTSAPYQHFAMATIRAIENKRYMVRSANTGISGIIDPVGKVIKKGPLFTDEILLGEISYIQEKTLYVKYGDWLCYLSLSILLVALLVSYRKSKQ